MSKSIPRIDQQVFRLFYRELLIEFRAKEQLTTMVIFALTTIIIFQFSFEMRTGNVKVLIPGVLWISVFFASMLSLNRSFSRDQEENISRGIASTPIDPLSIYISKVLTNTIFLCALEVILLPIITVLLNSSILYINLIPVLLVGNIGVSATGAIVAATVANTKSRETLLPVILLPLLLPVLLGCITATGAIIDEQPITKYGHWVQIVAIYDIIFTFASGLLFHFAIEN
ncbi:MAG: heme exporter protein CcmB [Chloroflexota bacterium]|nr:heme exporter protein CcmB [Chloroflexota bacterium]